MDNSVKISVIVPSYNQGEYIDNVIQSVINQNYNNWELIIQDGASNDCTAEVCEKYVNVDSRITFISEKDNGYADAVNKALDRATGELAVIQSSDDFFACNKVFEDVIGKYVNNKNLIIISGSSVTVNENLELFSTREMCEKYVPIENIFTTKDHFSQSATFFSVKRALTIGKLNSKVDMVADTDFWIRMACSQPISINSILQISKIYGGVVIQENQRTSDLSKFYLGRAQMAVNFLFDEIIPFSTEYKKRNANNFIQAGISHYKNIQKDILPFRILHKEVNGEEYEEPQIKKEKKTLKYYAKLWKKNVKKIFVYRNTQEVTIKTPSAINSKSEYYSDNANNPLIKYKWWI